MVVTTLSHPVEEIRFWVTLPVSAGLQLTSITVTFGNTKDVVSAAKNIRFPASTPDKR